MPQTGEAQRADGVIARVRATGAVLEPPAGCFIRTFTTQSWRLATGSNPSTGWTSGRVETQAATFGAPAGGVVRMQSSLQQPNVNTTNGLGYWPAFWMMPDDFSRGWPACACRPCSRRTSSRDSCCSATWAASTTSRR